MVWWNNWQGDQSENLILFYLLFFLSSMPEVSRVGTLGSVSVILCHQSQQEVFNTKTQRVGSQLCIQHSLLLHTPMLSYPPLKITLNMKKKVNPRTCQLPVMWGHSGQDLHCKALAFQDSGLRVGCPYPGAQSHVLWHEISFFFF